MYKIQSDERFLDTLKLDEAPQPFRNREGIQQQQSHGRDHHAEAIRKRQAQQQQRQI